MRTPCCYDCNGKSFHTRTHLNQHLSTYGHVKAWECDRCGKIFVDQETLQLQDAVHIVDCRTCTERFWTQEDLDRHVRQTHPFCCSPCDRNFNTSGALEMHNNDVHSYKCAKCSTGFPTHAMLQDHLDTSGHRTASTTMAANQQQAPLVSPSRCDICKATFDSTSILNEHNKSWHIFKCEKCSTVFQAKADLQSHVGEAHAFKCPKCNLKFGSETGMQRHIRDTHTFECKKCALALDSLALLKNHMADRHEFKCEKCPATLSSAPELVDHHLLQHSFRCDKCDHILSSPKLLQTHLTAAHNFKCRNSAIFETLEAMEQHHSAAHVFKCHKCLDAFDSQARLQIHIGSRHHFECEICDGDSFHSAEALVFHKCNAHLFQCPRCSESFTDLQKFAAHCATGHLFRCNTCPVLFESPEFKDYHKSLVHAPSTHNAGTDPFLANSSPDGVKQITIFPEGTPPATPTQPVLVQPINNISAAPERILHCHRCTMELIDTQVLGCIECKVEFRSQLELHQHLESKPHARELRWTLFVGRAA